MASGTEQAADVAAVHIRLADVNSVRARSQRHVNAVVDDQRHAAGGQQRFETNGPIRRTRACRIVFREAARRSLRRGRPQRPRRRAGGTGEAAVRDEVETPVARAPHAVSNFSLLRMSDS